jgi:hypothetical protein
MLHGGIGHMHDVPSGKKHRHIAGWIVAIVAIFEIAVVAGIVAWVRSGACALPTAQSVGRMIGGGGSESEPTGQGSPQPVPAAAASAATASPVPGSDGSAQAAGASGDLNQVPDPNCVAKTTAGLLNSDSSTAPPSCPPMSPPPALQKAAGEVQNMPATTPTP